MPPFDLEGSTRARPTPGPSSGGGFAFGPYQLESRSRQLRRNGELVALTPRQAAILHELVSHRGNVVSKERIVEVGWGVAAISDASIEKLFSQLRTILDQEDRARYIVNFARRGYRMVELVTDLVPDVDLEAILEPHRVYIDGRTLLEAFDCNSARSALELFASLLRRDAHDVIAHVGLANAYANLFEGSRASAKPDVESLKRSGVHSDQACRLAPNYAEAWATFGFVLERLGRRHDAVSALWRAVKLEPDNWLHWLRLAYGTWGQDRLRAIHELLKLVPALPAGLAMKAQVFIARGSLDLAHADIMRAAEEMAGGNIAPPVAPIHWIDGLLCFAMGRDADGLSALERELQLEGAGHLYAKEVCAQVWYTKASARYLDGDHSAAQGALEEVFTRMPYHPPSIVTTFLIDRRLGRVKPGSTLDDMEIWKQSDVPVGAPLWFERQVGIAIVLVDEERHEEASALLCQALELAPPGNSGWLIPLDLLLKVQSNKTAWRRTLARLSTRARHWLPGA